MLGIIIYLNTKNTLYKPFPPRIPCTNQRDLIRNLKLNINVSFILRSLRIQFHI